MVPEATAALSTSALAGRTSAELGGVALGPRRGQALLPVKYTSNPPPSFHLHQHPRPAQPISPISFWPSLLHPCPCTLSPFSPQKDGLKKETRANHSLRKNPPVASCCARTKAQAPSVGSQWALPNSSISSPLLAPRSATLVLFLFLKCTQLSSLPAIPGTWTALPRDHPWLVTSDSCFYLKRLSLERAARWVLPTPTFLPCLFTSQHFLFIHQILIEHLVCSRHCFRLWGIQQ